MNLHRPEKVFSSGLLISILFRKGILLQIVVLLTKASNARETLCFLSPFTAESNSSSLNRFACSVCRGEDAAILEPINIDSGASISFGGGLAGPLPFGGSHGARGSREALGGGFGVSLRIGFSWLVGFEIGLGVYISGPKSVSALSLLPLPAPLALG